MTEIKKRNLEDDKQKINSWWEVNCIDDGDDIAAILTIADSALNRAIAAEKENANFITTIESQKEEIERLFSIQNLWKSINPSVYQMFEIMAESERKIESLKAITELAVKGLKEIWHSTTGGNVFQIAENTLSKIERLTNG